MDMYVFMLYVYVNVYVYVYVFVGVFRLYIYTIHIERERDTECDKYFTFALRNSNMEAPRLRIGNIRAQAPGSWLSSGQKLMCIHGPLCAGAVNAIKSPQHLRFPGIIQRKWTSFNKWVGFNGWQNETP